MTTNQTQNETLADVLKRIGQETQNKKLAEHKLFAMIENLESGRFKIIVCDDGEERDVSADNIDAIRFILETVKSLKVRD